MRGLDPTAGQSERKLSLADFLKAYNGGLPLAFPRASSALLTEYQHQYPSEFKDGSWSLDLHRKKFMDWLPLHLESLEQK